MEKRYNKLHKKLKKLLKSWLVLLVWILVFSIVLQTAGIVIHELGAILLRTGTNEDYKRNI